MVGGKSDLKGIGDLSNKEKIALQRRYVLHCKYEEAVEMYADSKLPLCKIAVIRSDFLRTIPRRSKAIIYCNARSP